MSLSSNLLRQFAGFAVAMASTAALAQTASETKPPEPIALDVSPAPEPWPSLRYRLMPIVPDLNPGDAAPLYLRIRHETSTDVMNRIPDAETKWMKLPLSEFPTAEARKFVDSWGSKLKQIEFGAHRQTCDWDYSLPEQSGNAIEILLPDVQEMRQWARLLAMKARVEVAEKKYDEAIKTIETGLAFGRHVSTGPFLISALVGVAIEQVMFERLEELIAQPGAPNLYWALTALPEPLVSLRNAFEIEQRLGEGMVPELKRVDSEHTPEEWTAISKRMHQQVVRLTKILVGGEEGGAELKKRASLDYSQFRDELKAIARGGLIARGWNKDTVKSMSDDEAAVRYLVNEYQGLRDATFRVGYVPYRSVGAVYEGSRKAVEAARTGPLAPFAALAPVLNKAVAAEARLQRRIAALRCIEAIRMFAADHDGALPKSLGEIKAVPIPVNPVDGTPFEYRVANGVASLSAAAIDGIPESALRYDISLRK